ncbi:hypothetical protein PAXINDRAFT_21888 [Paxillus involutus ATCC 200175]|uniref:Uncharacterized protein n=1 Tax=Paxillus involutus ATCC 200175 TaxID=664439 RepID=A0A0C9SSS0_PAXIN|nr:hypothetical protein PAXINDRAFT_21888 [Paxillus involutus ATCC 200175]
MNIDGHGQYTPNERDSPRTPPEPPPAFHPPPAPSSPNHPERPCNVDNTKSNKTPAQHRADAVHDPGGETRAPGNKPPSVWLEGESSKRSSPYVETDDVEMEDDNLKSSKTATQQRADVVHNPGGQTDAPDSVPPSVRLEGERNRLTSLYVEVDNVKMDDDHAEDDVHTQQPSRHPVGTTDSVERRPNEPTEPPDKEEGERRGDGELRRADDVKSKVKTRVETVEGVETSQRVRGMTGTRERC